MLKKSKTIGMGNLIKLIVFIFLSNYVLSQQKKYPSVILVQKDTLVCFQTQQAKQMAVWNEQRKECTELRVIDSQKINQLQNKIDTLNGIVSDLETEIGEYKGIVERKDNLLTICEDEKKSLKKEVRKQKAGKWIAIIGGVVLSALCLAI